MWQQLWLHFKSHEEGVEIFKKTIFTLKYFSTPIQERFLRWGLLILQQQYELADWASGYERIM